MCGLGFGHDFVAVETTGNGFVNSVFVWVFMAPLGATFFSMQNVFFGNTTYRERVVF